MRIDDHPLLDLHVLQARLSAPIGDCASSTSLVAQLDPAASSPFPAPDDAVRKAVRDLLRHGGFKPSGRSKPASEYLRAAAAKGRLGPINLAVDICNAASLHSGLPISVVDRGLLQGDTEVGIAPVGASYVFNASGQELDLGGLLVLSDAVGPCANAVKDSQRTKTSAATTELLYLIWGTRALPDLAARTRDWVAEWCVAGGAAIS